MITSMLALNAILMLSVVVSIVGLMAWGILTQHRDHQTPTQPAPRRGSTLGQPTSPKQRALTPPTAHHRPGVPQAHRLSSP